MSAKYLLIIIIMLSLMILYAYTSITPIGYFVSYRGLTEPSIRDITSRDYSMLGEYSAKIERPLYCWLLSIIKALLVKLSFEEIKDLLINWYNTSVTDKDGIVLNTINKALEHGESFNNWKVDSINLIDIQRIPGIISCNDYTNCRELLDSVNRLLNNEGGDLIAGECTA